jgi:hypothetical protein
LQKIPDSVPVDVKILLQKFPPFFAAGDVKPTPTHGVEHHIHTGSHPPVFAKSRRLDPEKLQIAKAEFKRLESAGIIRSSKSPWASPSHMVPKKDGYWRLCGDYRRLKLVTTPDKYPLPNMQDLSNGLHAEVGERNFFLSPQSQFRNLKESLPQSRFRNFLKKCCSAIAIFSEVAT